MLFTARQVAEMIFSALNTGGVWENEKEQKIAEIEQRLIETYTPKMEGSFIEVVEESNTYKIHFGDTVRDEEELFLTALNIMKDEKFTGQEISTICLNGEEWVIFEVGENGIVTFVNKDMSKRKEIEFGGEIFST